MNNLIIAFISLLLCSPQLGNIQDELTTAIPFRVNKIFPSISWTKKELKAAKTISDINPFYKRTWIKEFKSVEISAWNQGKEKKVYGTDDQLNSEQKEIINNADYNSAISVIIKYIPDNTLINNDVKTIDFSLTIEPDKDAYYHDGQKALDRYLTENAISKIPEGAIEGYRIAAVRFTIDEEGQIVEPHIAWSSENASVDTILWQTICNMPNWIPATFADGTKVKQEFALSVGNEESCAMYVLNTRRKLDPID